MVRRRYRSPIEATSSPGYTFSSWSSSSPSITFASPSSTSTTATIGDTGTITAGFTFNAPTVTVVGAYHGARVSWTDVGAASYNIYYNTANDPTTATQVTTGVTGTTYDVKNLPDTTWDKVCYYWVAPVGSSGEAPKSSWGSGSDKVWIYKVEITIVTATTHATGDIRVEVQFQSRDLDGPVTVQLEIGEYLGPGSGASIPNRPINILSTGSVTLQSFQSLGSFVFETQSNSEVRVGQ